MKKRDEFRRTAVLLLAFGGPRSLEEVAPFLERLTERRPSYEQIAGLKRRYQAIGGASPLPEMTLRQAKALEAELKKRGKLIPIYCGMRYSQPFIAEALEEIQKNGITRTILVSLSPYTAENYYAEVKRAAITGKKSMDLMQVDEWHTHPLLCAAWGKSLTELMETNGEKRQETPVIFTAHSLPRDVALGSSYVKHLEETIKGIIKITGGLRSFLAFQSRGKNGGQWLGPQPEDVIKGLAQEGCRKVLICPIGFITDHLETLYDLDIALKEWADEWRMEILRAPCLNDSPTLIEILAERVAGVLEKK